MHKIMFTVAASAAAFLFAGCCQTECTKSCTPAAAPAVTAPIAAPATVAAPTGTWGVSALPAAEAKKLADAPNAFIGFEKDRVYGCAGDNRFFGGYKIDGSKIEFGHMGVTRMAGPNMQYEDCFLKALNDTRSFSLKDGKLTFCDADGKELISFAPKKIEKK